MPLNLLSVPRKQQAQQQAARKTQHLHPLVSLALVVGVLSLAAIRPSARQWIFAGAGIESLLLIGGATNGRRILPSTNLWLLLAALNIVFAVCATSWLLSGVFICACYTLVLLTCLLQFDSASRLLRKLLRLALLELHFTRDVIALFNLPALEIDTDVAGLFVVRGISISLSSMRIVAHGVELGLRLADDIELALHVDEVDIRLFRQISIGEVYGNVKGGKETMTFADLETSDTDDDSIFQVDTSLLQAASASKRPKLSKMKSQMTGGSYMKDQSVRESFDSITLLAPDDANAERTYQNMLKQIATTGPISEARNELRNSGTVSDTDADLRAAICVKLQHVPTVPHPPTRSISVTTLQTLSPPWLRRFLHRLPFLLRLLLMPLAYFHPIHVESISVAGSGSWIATVMKEKLFSNVSEENDLRRLERKVFSWLASAEFCLQLGALDAVGSVPLDSSYDVKNYLQFADIIAYRVVPQSQSVLPVIRMGGADAYVSLPSYLLPHHEHLLPPVPEIEDVAEQEQFTRQTDDKIEAVEATNELEKMQKDETEMHIAVHGRLPVVLDQSLLNFTAALVKATKVIEMQKAVNEELEGDGADETVSIYSATEGDEKSSTSRLKAIASAVKQNIKDGTTIDALKETARDVHQSAKNGLKRAAVQNLANDRWIAKLVGQCASKLENAMGDVGYSGAVNIPLKPYRDAAEPLSKLLP